MTPEDRRLYNLLETRLAQIERERRQYWPIPMVGGVGATRPSIWVCQGGKALVNYGINGGIKITTTLSGSSMPVGTGSPGSTVEVPAFPIPAGLPDGVAVGRLVGTTTYAFLLIDGTVPYGEDLLQNDQVHCDGTTVLSQVSGGVTYTYTCQNVIAAF